MSWVSPAGNDQADGSEQHPLATLGAALSKNPSGVLEVTPGTYRLRAPLVLSGANRGLVIEAKGGTAVISGQADVGGAQLATSEPTGPGMLRFPNARIGQRVWVDGNEVQSRGVGTSSQPWHYSTESDLPAEVLQRQSNPLLRVFRPEPGDVHLLASLAPDQLKDVVVTIWHSWEISRAHVASVDESHGTVTLDQDSPWKLHEFSKVQRYQIDNLPLGVGASGAWYVGADMHLDLALSAVPRGLDSQVIAGGLPEILQIHDTQDITIRGVQFSYSGTTIDSSHYKASQAADTVGAAVVLDRAQNVNFDRVTVSHTGGYGIWFRASCSGGGVHSSLLQDLGAGGIRVGTTGKAPPPGDETTGVLIEDNILRGGGRLFPGAVGILVGNSGANRILHNEIDDFYYSGISVGWKWEYGPSPARGNLIEGNVIHHIGQEHLADMAGIYTLGESPGTVVRLNIVHDVEGYPGGAGAWGMYADQGSSGIAFERNLVYRTTSGGFHENFGHDNVIRNNVFAYGGDGAVLFNKGEPHRSLEFSGNAVISNGKGFFVGDWRHATADIDGNFYFDPTGQARSWLGLSFGDWQKLGFDAKSKIMDPGFTDPQHDNFQLKPGAAWSWNGESPITSAGVRGDDHWRALAHANDALPDYQAPMEPRSAPIAVAEDFESTPVGAVPGGLVAMTAGAGVAIGVTADLAAQGSHSLEIQDVAAGKFQFDPHAYYRLDHASGTTTVRFQLRTEAGACFTNEWRDGAQPFHIGPGFTVSGKQLRAAGRILATIPESTWIGITMTAQEGVDRAPEWQLRLDQPGAKPSLWSLPQRDPRWNSLNWLGFVSSCRSSGRIFLDDIRVTNR